MNWREQAIRAQGHGAHWKLSTGSKKNDMVDRARAQRGDVRNDTGLRSDSRSIM